MSDRAVLVVNAGSSSLKFALYPHEAPVGPGGEADHAAASAALAAGQLEGLQPGGQLRLCPADGPVRVLDSPADEHDRYALALDAMLQHVQHAAPGVAVAAVAHRIVHGGPNFRAPVVLTDAVLAELATLEPLAPLHQPHNLAGVRALRRREPALLQVGCFDTAFHAGMPEVEHRFALPESLHEQGVRRYGFHGLSYDFVMHSLLHTSPIRSQGRVLMAHLGNGASLCAARGGRSIATSMGFSALDGLVMGTRCGTLDAGVLLHLWRQGWSLAEVERLLYRDSGLLGVSGRSADMRELHRLADAGDVAARRAIEVFVYRLRREAGGLTTVLGGLDLLACTGGIGEHDARIRAELAHGLVHLGVQLDEAANQAARGDRIEPIHGPGSAVEVWVVPTDEGRVAAQAAWALLDARDGAARTA
ncbi:acetate kinase [Sphaerotilus hippei]|uniref:Acetate kinase n=1 Tax=Sphaerotilus hippei TaxID=744406 RepID=A0A318HCI6_9BURK|nr:acetate/propionate family kinase [Sphaerotilus hippei]PXW96991.1 acetate kinase [Sphaerotilus hippei]